MARLRDVPAVIKKLGFVTFVKRIWAQVQDDNLLTWAAALAYSWLFAIFPFMVFLMSLLPYLPSNTKSAAEDQIKRMVYEYAPPQAADTIWKEVHCSPCTLRWCGNVICMDSIEALT